MFRFVALVVLCCSVSTTTAFASDSYDVSSTEFQMFEEKFRLIEADLSGSRASEFMERIRELGYLNYNLIEAFAGYIDEYFFAENDSIDTSHFDTFREVAMDLRDELLEPEIVPTGAEYELTMTIANSWKALRQSLNDSNSAESTAASAAEAAAVNVTVPRLRVVCDENGARATPRDTQSARTPRFAISPRILQLRACVSSRK